MNVAGARVVNYIAKHPDKYRETKQADSRTTQDAKMAKKKQTRLEEGFWGKCAVAVMSSVPDPDIDDLQVTDEYEASGHFDLVDPSVPSPPCMLGMDVRDAASRCKKAAAELATAVSKAIENMCQSGEGDLKEAVIAAMTGGSGGAAFPSLDGDEGSGLNSAPHGSSPYHFLSEPMHKYWYSVLQSEDLLSTAIITMPMGARASSDSGTATATATSDWGSPTSTVPSSAASASLAAEIEAATGQALAPLTAAMQSISSAFGRHELAEEPADRARGDRARRMEEAWKWLERRENAGSAAGQQFAARRAVAAMGSDAEDELAADVLADASV